MTMMELQEQATLAGEPELERLLKDMQTRESALLARAEAYFDRREGERENAKRALDELRFVRRLEERIERRLEEI